MESEDIKVLTIEYPDESYLKRYGSLGYDDAIEVIEDFFDLNHSHCVGIQKFGKNPKRIDIAIKKDFFYMETVQDHIGKE